MILKYLNITLLLVGTLLFSACSYSKIDLEKVKNPDLPNKYNSIDENLSINENWLMEFNDDKLLKYVDKALNNNLELKQAALDIKIKQSELNSTNSLFLPSADLSINETRSGDFESSEISNSSSLSVGLKYELDLWGKLSDEQKRANKNLFGIKASYEEAKQKLVSDVVNNYYDIVEANKLIEIYKLNLQNAKNSLEIINKRYKQGLSTALDVYNAKNSMNSQELKLNQSRANKKLAIYKLEHLLGEYPKALLSVNTKIPLLTSKINIGVPSELIFRKASLNTSWNSLLAKDYSLAIAHKNRFPSLNLSANISENLSSSSPTSWSLIGGITAPIFNAGLLKAKEDVAFYELKKAELSYLNDIYTAFVEIESLVVNEDSLKNEYILNLNNNKNTKISLELAMSQYLKGLSEYINVISSQDSFFNSKANLVQTKIKIIKNKISLHKALGGDFLEKKEENR